MPNNTIEQQGAIDALIIEEQTRLLYEQAPISNSTIYILAILFYFLLQPQIDTGMVEVWIVALFATAGFRLALWWVRRRHPRRRTSKQWLRAYLFGCLLVGVAWSLIVPSIYIANNLTVAVGLSMLLFGVIASAVVVLSIYIPAFVVYIFPQMFTLMGTLLAYGDVGHNILAVATLVYLIMTTLFTRNITDEKGPGKDIHPVAILVTHLVLDVEVVPLAVDVIPQRQQGSFAAFFVNKDFPGCKFVRQFMCLVAQHVLPSRGVVDLPALQVP
ncbi:MAG: hypothetical protein P8166_17755, partial [Candidatus Thiodiazotropha sp.]